MNTDAATLENMGFVEEFPTYLDSDSVDKTLERYVFFPGNLITARRQHECREHVGVGLSWNGKPFRIVANGGDEYHTPCLTRTKGFVPRGFITPLEVAAHWIPPELLPNGAQAFSAASNVAAAPAVAGGVYVGSKSQYLVGEKVFPGQALSWMLSFARNDQGYSRGLVELEALRGQKWADGTPEELQRLFFPTYPAQPETLSELQRGLDAVTKLQSGDVREMGQVMLNACDEFRDYGLAFLGREHTLVKVGTTANGWTYTYSDTAKLLMAQLEVTAQDQQFQTVAKMQEEQARNVLAIVEAMANKGNDSAKMMEMFLANQERIAAAMEQMARGNAPVPVAEPAKDDAKPSPKLKTEK